MTAPLVEAATTTPVGSRPSPSPKPVALHTGLLSEATFGTSSGISDGVRWANPFELVTTMPSVPLDLPAATVADEVRELRDYVCSHGLTRQDVARAVGVDRRSLSAWVRGEMRPAAERLRVMHTLARLVNAVASERPGRVRDVLLARRCGAALIDRLGTDGARVLDVWRAVVRPEAKVTLRPVGRRPEPIWAAAARAAAQGRLSAPTSSRTIRSASTYEMDLDEAGSFEEPELEYGRRGYR